MATIRIQKIKSAMIEIAKTHPPTLEIIASGIVPTSGYSNPKLDPYVYIHPPANGIWDFDFSVEQPNGPNPDVITEMIAKLDWSMPKDLKGIRIHGHNGEIILYIV